MCVEDRFTVNILSSKEDLSRDLTVKRSGCQILLKGSSKINTLGDMLKAERPRNGSIIYRCVAKMQQEMSCRECMSRSFFCEQFLVENTTGCHFITTKILINNAGINMSKSFTQSRFSRK